MKRSNLFNLFNIIIMVSLFSIILVNCDSNPVDSPIQENKLEKSNGVPADGNGNKFVYVWEDSWTTDCGLNAHIYGRGQLKWYNPNNPKQVELGVFHFVFTYTDNDGNTFIWRDVGADRIYFEDEILYVAITGTSTATGTTDRTEVQVGRVVISDYDPFAFEGVSVVFQAGRDLPAIDEMACNALN